MMFKEGSVHVLSNVVYLYGISITPADNVSNNFRYYFARGYCADCYNTLGIYSGGFISNVLEERPR